MKNIKKMKKAEIDAANQKFYALFTVGREQASIRNTPYNHNLVTYDAVVNTPTTIIEAVILFLMGGSLIEGTAITDRVSPSQATYYKNYAAQAADSYKTKQLENFVSISTFIRNEDGTSTLQSRRARTRSFADLVCFVNSYFPAHYLEIFSVVKRLSFHEKIKGASGNVKYATLTHGHFVGGYCSTIQRPTIYFNRMGTLITKFKESIEKTDKDINNLLKAINSGGFGKAIQFDISYSVQSEPTGYKTILQELENLETNPSRTIYISDVKRAQMIVRMFNL